MNFRTKSLLLCLCFQAALVFQIKLARAATLARVNAQTISEEDFRQALLSLGQNGELVLNDSKLKRNFLEYLIAVELRVEAAKKQRIDQSAEFRKRLKAAEKQVLSSMLYESWERELESQASLKSAFNKDREFYIRSAVHVAHIYLGEKEDANRVLRQALEKPGIFSDLVRKYSRSNTKLDGDLGWITKGQQELGFEKAVFNARKGEVYPRVVASGAGFHILKVIDVKYHPRREFKDFLDDITAVRRREISNERQLSLVRGAKVEKDLTLLERVKA